MTTVVVTMAGGGTRFRDAGYALPKYEIAAHGHSLFWWSLNSLRHFIESSGRVIFVCLAENESVPFVRQQCTELGVERYRTIELDKISAGQASSAYLSQTEWLADQPLVIFNIDTMVDPVWLQPESIPAGSDGWIPCCRASGDHWSFVRTDENACWAVEVAEKRRISHHASIGFYWFSRPELFIDAYHLALSDSASSPLRERYVAPLYQTMIEAGRRISILEIPTQAVNVLGTPAELATFINRPMPLIQSGKPNT